MAAAHLFCRLVPPLGSPTRNGESRRILTERVTLDGVIKRMFGSNTQWRVRPHSLIVGHIMRLSFMSTLDGWHSITTGLGTRTITYNL